MWAIKKKEYVCCYSSERPQHPSERERCPSLPGTERMQLLVTQLTRKLTCPSPRWTQRPTVEHIYRNECSVVGLASYPTSQRSASWIASLLITQYLNATLVPESEPNPVVTHLALRSRYVEVSGRATATVRIKNGRRLRLPRLH